MSGRNTGRHRGKPPAKADLPVKTCAACGRPFAWRRKWAACWEQVRYCSARCRAGKASPSGRGRPQAG